MVKKSKVDPKDYVMLSHEEMKNISGGSLTETIVKMVISATGYFFMMGITEARRMKAML